MNIITWREETFELSKGGVVEAMIRPLTVDETIIIQPFMVTSEDGKADRDVLFKGQRAMAPVFNEAVKNMKGITIDGEDITPEQLSTQSMLSELAWKIIIKLMSISSIKEEEEVFSEGQSLDPDTEESTESQ